MHCNYSRYQITCVTKNKETKMSEYAHCLNYKIAFKHEDFSQVKLFEEVGGKFEKCVVFTDTFGFEGLLYVEERFREVAKQLEYDGEQCFINFPKVLQGTALSNWKILVRGIHPDFQTLNDFNTQIKTLIAIIVMIMRETQCMST